MNHRKCYRFLIGKIFTFYRLSWDYYIQIYRPQNTFQKLPSLIQEPLLTCELNKVNTNTVHQSKPPLKPVPNCSVSLIKPEHSQSPTYWDFIKILQDINRNHILHFQIAKNVINTNHSEFQNVFNAAWLLTFQFYLQNIWKQW